MAIQIGGSFSNTPVRQSGTVTEVNTMSGTVDRPSTVYVAELHFSTYTNFPETGNSNYLYIATDSNTMYRWDGTQYVCTSDKNYTHRQQIASAVWVIEHNLHKYPSVMVKDSDGNVVLGEIAYDTENQITITFSAAFTGRAYLN